MALYSIKNETCLGMSHSGAVNVNSEGYVDLSDEEVAKIVDLIRKVGTHDMEELGLEEECPEIYEKLDDAYFTMARKAEELHWLWEGYENECYEFDEDELMEYCEQECGFTYEEDDCCDEDGEIDEEDRYYAKRTAFFNWLDDYLRGLSDDDAVEFFIEHMNAELDLSGIEYEVVVPEAIIKMAGIE